MNTAKKTGLVLVLLAMALILLSLVVPIDWFPSIAWGTAAVCLVASAVCFYKAKTSQPE